MFKLHNIIFILALFGASQFAEALTFVARKNETGTGSLLTKEDIEDIGDLFCSIADYALKWQSDRSAEDLKRDVIWTLLRMQRDGVGQVVYELTAKFVEEFHFHRFLDGELDEKEIAKFENDLSRVHDKVIQALHDERLSLGGLEEILVGLDWSIDKVVSMSPAKILSEYSKLLSILKALGRDIKKLDPSDKSFGLNFCRCILKSILDPDDYRELAKHLPRLLNDLKERTDMHAKFEDILKPKHARI